MVEVDLDKIFCMMSGKWKIHKLLLKAMGIQESSLKTNAYRYEPGYYEWLKKQEPGRWDNRDPRIVSASYGIMQIMYTTAVGLGLDEDFDFNDLLNPVYNIDLGAKYFRILLDAVEKSGVHIQYGIWPYRIALARYNGGYGGNPRPDGTLRNQAYVDSVFKIWKRLRDNGELDTCHKTQE